MGYLFATGTNGSQGDSGRTLCKLLGFGRGTVQVRDLYGGE